MLALESIINIKAAYIPEAGNDNNSLTQSLPPNHTFLPEYPESGSQRGLGHHPVEGKVKMTRSA